MELNVLTPKVARGALSPRRLVGRNAVVRVTKRLKISPERVFDAWVDARTAGKWLFATALRPVSRVRIDARVGGSFCFVEQHNGEEFSHIGKYLEIARSRRLVFTLFVQNGTRVSTRVVVELMKRGTGCELVVTHEDVPLADVVDTRNRWTGILYGLDEMLGRSSVPPPAS